MGAGQGDPLPDWAAVAGQWIWGWYLFLYVPADGKKTPAHWRPVRALSRTNPPPFARSLTQCTQSILRLVNAAGDSLGIEFPCLRDIAAPVEDSPCRQHRPVVRLRQ